MLSEQRFEVKKLEISGISTRVALTMHDQCYIKNLDTFKNMDKIKFAECKWDLMKHVESFLQHANILEPYDKVTGINIEVTLPCVDITAHQATTLGKSLTLVAETSATFSFPEDMDERCAIKIADIPLQSHLKSKLLCFITLGHLTRFSEDDFRNAHIPQSSNGIGAKTMEGIKNLLRSAGLELGSDLPIHDKELAVVLETQPSVCFDYSTYKYLDSFPTFQSLTETTESDFRAALEKEKEKEKNPISFNADEIVKDVSNLLAEYSLSFKKV